MPKRRIIPYSVPKHKDLGLNSHQSQFVLQPQEAWFAEEFPIDLDAVEAARRAGINDPERNGPRLLALKKIQRAVALAKGRRATRVQIQADYVIKRWKMLVDADPRELTEVWLVACRYCWGVDHRFQLTDGEWREQRAAHQEAMLTVEDPEQREDFDEQGGPGYTINRFPMRGDDFVALARAHGQEVEANADHSCPECHGHGEKRAIFHDTRTLSPGGRILYKGVKVGPNGSFEVLMRDQERAEAMLAKHLGNFDSKLAPPKPVEQMTDEELQADLEANGVELEGEFTRVDGGAPAPAFGAGVPAKAPSPVRTSLDAD